MDWPRAKSILILCFLALNILLAYGLYIEPMLQGDSDNLSRERLDSIMNVLAQNGVRVDFALPRTTPRLSFYRVATGTFTAEEVFGLRNSLLGPDALLTSVSALPDPENPASFLLDQKELIVTAFGSVAYYNHGNFLSGNLPPLTPEEARGLADTFLEERLGGPGDYVFDAVHYVPVLGHRVEYVQRHEETPVYPGQLVVLVRPSGVAALWKLRLSVISREGAEKRIISAPEALLNMLSHRLNTGQTAPVVVEELELGYYSQVYDTFDSWPVAPVWRVRTDSGDYHINAHSGIIEE